MLPRIFGLFFLHFLFAVIATSIFQTRLPIIIQPAFAFIKFDLEDLFYRQARNELILPDLQTMPPSDLRLVVSGDGERKVIRFSNSIANMGPGAVEFRGQYNRASQTVMVMQQIYRLDGSSTLRPVGELVYHSEHEHWHWDGFSLYEVWSINPDGSLDTLQASSGKVGYCLRDDGRISTGPDGASAFLGRPISPRARYTGCGWSLQGISVGWMDVYEQDTPGQFVNISGLEDGTYALRSAVDPEHRIYERIKINNSAVVYFTLQQNRLEVLGETPELLLTPNTAKGND